MLPEKLQTAIGTCLVDAFVKRAQYHRKMRAVLVKRAAALIAQNYKTAPSQTKLQRLTSKNPVPGSAGREAALRPSMAKSSLDAMSGQAPIPKMQGAPKPPSGLGASNPLGGLSADTKFDLQNRQNSPGNNLFNPKNPTYAAMRAPDPARLAPKPAPQYASVNTPFTVGTGPSGNPVQARIVNQGMNIVAEPPKPTAAEQASDDAYHAKVRAFNQKIKNQPEFAPGTPPLTQLLSRMTPGQRRDYTKWLQSDPNLYANRNEIAAKKMQEWNASSQPAANPLTAPIDIPEMQPQPTATPVDLTSAPESIPAAAPPIPTADSVQAKAQQVAFPSPAPTPNYAAMSPSQQLNAAQSPAPARTSLQADQPASMSPNAVIANLLTQLGQGAGRGLSSLQALPGYLTQQMQSGLNPIAQRFNSGMPTSSLMQMLNQMPMHGSDDFKL
jgi:hypothetical protein